MMELYTVSSTVCLSLHPFKRDIFSLSPAAFPFATMGLRLNVCRTTVAVPLEFSLQLYLTLDRVDKRSARDSLITCQAYYSPAQRYERPP